jgi:hypothetical protein
VLSPFSQFLFRSSPRVIALGLFSIFFLIPHAVGQSSMSGPNSSDELVYHDGDRVRGRLVEKDGDTLVFQSQRFGLLRVSNQEASVFEGLGAMKTQRTGEIAAKESPSPSTVSQEDDESDNEALWRAWEYLYPNFLKDYLRDIFGPWSGRFSFSTELVSDTKDRSTVTAAAKVRRQWERDDVEMSIRYDYTETEDVPTRDIAKMTGSWRHDFESRLFALYNPAVEWNRNFVSDGVESEYLLLQQELGAGVNLINRDDRQLRVGLSENRFDVWVTDGESGGVGGHQGTNVESVFMEAEWQLPWEITLSDRGVYYYSLSTNEDGWENRFQVDKKLTETLTIGVLHELRHNNPDVRVSDYRLLKLLIGLDF